MQGLTKRMLYPGLRRPLPRASPPWALLLRACSAEHNDGSIVACVGLMRLPEAATKLFPVSLYFAEFNNTAPGGRKRKFGNAKKHGKAQV
jgi:hypothetical protein